MLWTWNDKCDFKEKREKENCPFGQFYEPVGFSAKESQGKANRSKHVREDFAYEVHQKVQPTASRAHRVFSNRYVHQEQRH